jgi:hypothetical protein
MRRMKLMMIDTTGPGDVWWDRWSAAVWDNWFTVEVETQSSLGTVVGQGRTFELAVLHAKDQVESFAPGMYTFETPEANAFSKRAMRVVNAKRRGLLDAGPELVDVTEDDDRCHTTAFSMLPELTFSGRTLEEAERKASMFLESDSVTSKRT